jgi:hypothetical protein
MPSSAPINSKQLNGRRPLHFNHLDEALGDADNLAAANARGELRCVGNWMGGQILGRVAAWVHLRHADLHLSFMHSGNHASL